MSAARAAVFALAALLLAAPGFARAQGAAPPAAGAIPDVRTIRAAVRAAEHAPAAYRETVVIASSDGTATTERRYVRGDDERVIDDDGTFHTESGSRNGTRWLQNRNGQTVTDRADPGRAVPERVRTVLSVTPAGAYVVAMLNAKGRGRKEYVDPATWRVVRRERIVANGTIVTTYEDVRDDRGRVFAHGWHVDDPVQQTTSDARVTEYEPGAVSDVDLAQPPSRRTLVAFPDGVTAAVLPAEFDRHIYVRVTIAGRGMDFVLDTGASGIVLDTKVARDLGLRLYAEHSNVVAGRTTYARAVVPEMQTGPLAMRDVAVIVVPLGWKEAGHVRVAGLLGFDFLAQLGVTIDYENRRVTVVPSGAYAAPSDPHTSALDVRLGRGIPLVTASLDGAFAERVGIDTGGVGAFLLFDYFTRRNPAPLPDIDALGGGETTLAGVGGGFAASSALVSSFEVGGFRFRNVRGSRVTSDQSFSQDSDGVIGEGLLRYFTLGLDYANERVYLTPNAEGRKALAL
jgi:clan AA aspartic protease (TIGR02281 family)